MGIYKQDIGHLKCCFVLQISTFSFLFFIKYDLPCLLFTEL